MVLLLALLGCPGTADYDGDGFVEPEDCNDNNAGAYPGATEIPYDRVDQDCDGFDLTDVDGDGWDAEEVGGQDCNDFRRKVNPTAQEIPYDGIDQNCDGWSDDDFDQDGYLAKGHGGDDCDDFDARVVPLDEDGDGFTPCTGDCDETNPLRNPAALAKCGNGIEDNCDGVPDCAPAGYGELDDAPIRIMGGAFVEDVGWDIALVGDATGDGLGDIWVAGLQLEADPEVDPPGVMWLFDGPLPAVTGPLLAAGRVLLPGDDPQLAAAGDVDGDGLGDVLVSSVTLGTSYVGLIPGGLAGDVPYTEAATLRLEGPTSSRVGSSLASLDGGARLAVGARYWQGDRGAVELIRPQPEGAQIAFGETGALLLGEPGQYSAGTLGVVDIDGDGLDDLIVDFPGAGPTSDAGAYLLVAPPESGSYQMADLASATLDLVAWGRTMSQVDSADLDDDGQQDLVVGMPTLGDMVGGVAAFTTPPSGDFDPDEASILRYGLGDDTFGASFAASDYDGDGFDDLLVGAPAFWNSGGGAYKPGAIHLWYGPLKAGSALSLEADWFMDGTWSGVRTRAGHRVGFQDLDGDGLDDMVVASPRDASGVVHVFPGGMSAIGGI